MIVIGIDPSLVCTAVVIGDAFTAPMVERIETDPKTFSSRTHRIEYMRMRLELALAPWRAREKPSLALIEAAAFSQHTGRSNDRNEWRGQILRELWESGIPYAELAPNCVKKFATDNGRAEKTMVGVSVFERWGFRPSDDNDSDAYVLWRIACEWASSEPSAYVRKLRDRATIAPGVDACRSVLDIIQEERERTEKRLAKLKTAREKDTSTTRESRSAHT